MNYEENLGYLLNKAARLTKWDLTNKLNCFGITSSQWAVLKNISVYENIYKNTDEQFQYLSLAAIAQRLRSDRPTMSEIIKRLVKDGWVYKVANPQDGRSQMVVLTDKTRELITEFEDMSTRTLEQAVEGLNDEDVIQLKKYLAKIIENLS